MDIGRAILEIRKEKGLKQETVALEAGTDTGYLSRIEQGIRKPSLAMLEKFAIALGTSVSTIALRAEGTGDFLSTAISARNATESNDIAHQLRCQFLELSLENQKVAVELLKALNKIQKNK
ncbi:MAG: helix-turn-helix transcriptional regulator [Methylotenera sp.]